MSRIEADSTVNTPMKGDPFARPYESLLNEDGLGDRIRVLELHPGKFDNPISVSLKVHLMSAKPEYEALSYAWGTDKCDTLILVDGHLLEVNANLDTALRHLRYNDESRFLWIDAICINQHSTAERNHQVQLMGTIYPNARDVLVWLGPASDSSDFLMRAIENKWNINGALYPFFKQAVSSFLERSWFSRLWVVQEVSLSCNDAIVLCGSKETRFSPMADYILRQMQFDSDDMQFSIRYDANPIWLDLAHEHEIEAEKIVEKNLELQLSGLLFSYLVTLLHLKTIATEHNSLHLTDLFHGTSNKICTDPRDKIFALYGLAISGPDHREDYMSVRPDYSKSVAQVFSATTRLFFSRKLETLYANWPLRSYGGPQFHNVPSWIPDFCFIYPEITTSMTEQDIKDFFRGYSFMYFNQHKIQIKTPLVRFSADSMILYAAGIYHGEIRQIIPFSSGKDTLHKLITSNSELEISVQKLFDFFWKIHFGKDYPRSGMKKSDIGLEKNLDGLWSFMPLSSLTNVVLFTTSTKHWGISNKSLREKDTVAGLFGYDVPFVLRSRPQGGFWMITTAQMGDSEAVKSLPELVDGHESLEGFAKYGLEEFEIH